MIELGYDELSKAADGKRVLYIPIVSCIDRQTDEYNLDCDGNVNRTIATIDRLSGYKEIDIVLPFSKHETIVKNWAEPKDKVNIIFMAGVHGRHAKDQRVNYKLMYSNIGQYDLYIIESQTLAKRLIEDGKDVVFYCPVSKAKGKTRVFLEGYDEINEWLFNNAKYTVVCSPDQYDDYSGNFKSKMLYLPVLCDYVDYSTEGDISRVDELSKNRTVVYLPYRLTDEGYRINDVINYVNKLSETTSIIVAFSNPNNCDLKLNFKDDIEVVNVGTSRSMYCAMLKSPKVMIPYFEDIEFVNHAAIWEILDDSNGCTFVYSPSVDITKYGFKQNNRIIQALAL